MFNFAPHYSIWPFCARYGSTTVTWRHRARQRGCCIGGWLGCSERMRPSAASLLCCYQLATTVATCGAVQRSMIHSAALRPQMRWMAWDDGEEDAAGQQASGANLFHSQNLSKLDQAHAMLKMRGLWAVKALCTPNVNQIFREPYCAGLPAGLATNWSVGVEYVVSQLASRPHVAGVFLGDEPEIGGVPGEQMCELSLVLKRRLQQAGRGDVFLYYNDGPGSIQLKRSGGLCAGLDYWSLDQYQDSGEAAGVAALLAPLLPKLRGPRQ
jgi:hypothetical protein